MSPLLAHDEPPPFEIVRPEGRSRVVLTCDHASARIPRALGDLGVSTADRATHIAWDIGAAEVARRMSERLDATLVLAGYSRLVVDCNRPPHVASAMPAVTGGVPIPGNSSLDEATRAARVESFHAPYHRAITRLLDERAAQGRPPVLLSIHSFTPELQGQRRPWPIALLYGRDARLAHACRDALRRDPTLSDDLVGDNQPYRVSDESDFTIPVHGERRGLLHTAFEIRQDGIDRTDGALAWADRLAALWLALAPSFVET
jgi:predicted N-formylglutamate amidohydrolase